MTADPSAAPQTVRAVRAEEGQVGMARLFFVPLIHLRSTLLCCAVPPTQRQESSPMHTASLALVALALPTTVAADDGGNTAALAGIFGTLAMLFGMLVTLVTIAMKAGKWQQKVEHRLDQTDGALAALADRFGSVETTVAEGADSRRDIRAAVDDLAERLEAGDAARQGIQNTLDNVAQALNP